MIEVGTRVLLKACRAGLAGAVIRRERGRLVILWPDMDYISRHKEASLEKADTA